MGISCRRVMFALAAVLWALAGRPVLADDSLKLAEDYLWLGMAADGDPLSFDKARAVLRALPADKRESAPARALAETIDIQAAIAAEKLSGRFPLARMLADEPSSVHHELWEPTEEVATRAAAQKLLQEVIAARTSAGRAALVIMAPSASRRLEGEVLNLAAAASITPMTRRDVLEALGNDEAALQRLGPDAAQALLAAAHGADLVVMNLRPKRLQGGDAMVEAEARVLFADTKRLPLVFSTRGFGFDRRDWVLPLAAINAGLGLVAVGVVVAVLRRRALGGQPFGHDLAMAVAAFAFGRLAPLGAFGLVASVVPAPLAAARLPAAGWWPCWIGLVLFVLPMVVWRVAGPRLAAQVPLLASAGRLGILGLGVGLGAAAHAAGPLVMYLEEGAWPALLATAMAAAAIGYATGRGVDRFDSRDVLWGLPPLVLAALLGAALSAALAPAILAIAALAVLAVALPAGLEFRAAHRRADHRLASADAADSAAAPVWELPATGAVLAQADGFRPGAVLWLGLAGDAGAGKSALIERVLEGWRGDGLTLLRGACSPLPGSHSAPPFGPIQQALAGRMELAAALRRDGRNALIGSAIEDAAAMLLGPMAGFLRGDCGAASEADLFVFIARKLRELSLAAPVALVIDDIQWLDESSKALLAYLRTNLRGENGRGIAILLAGRAEAGAVWAGLGTEPVRVDALDDSQQRDFLCAGLGLSAPAAAWVVRWLGDGIHTPGRLKEAVEHLARNGALEGGELAARLPAALPPLPGAAERVREALAALPQARNALTAAACLGLRFEVALVAEAVERPLGETIALLDEVERATGLIRDAQGGDATYTFVSLQVLDAVRAALGAGSSGPLAAGVPQIVRHLNARLADALAARGIATVEDRLRLALHRHGAGRSQAAQAVAACCDAAQALARMFRYDEARDMVSRARDCARISGEAAEVERVAWSVDAAQAHVQGVAEDSAAIARRGLDLVEDAPELLGMVAQSCYDGVRADRALLAETARLAERMAAGPDVAEGLHLMALAAPRDGSDFRVATLRRALAAAEGETRARIANSLAEELSGDPAARDEAQSLFQLSLDLKNQAEIRDLPGLARTHGGMGRLAFFAQPPDLEAARVHFEEDLRLSEQIGDRRGISKMHSLLGAVALKQGRGEDAERHYRRSIAENVDRIDVCLSLAGLLDRVRASGDAAAFATLAEEARGHDFSDLPPFARDELARALAEQVPA